MRRCHAAGSLIAASCSGAMLLGEAGLLDDDDATTHWAFCEVLQRRYPRARVRPHCALVASGEGQRLVMTGGGSSWMDLALYLIARYVGVEAAMQVAQAQPDRLAPRGTAALRARGEHAAVRGRGRSAAARAGSPTTTRSPRRWPA